MKPNKLNIVACMLCLCLTGCGTMTDWTNVLDLSKSVPTEKELRQQQLKAQERQTEALRQEKALQEEEQRRIAEEKMAAKERAALLASYRKNNGIRVIEVEKTCLSRLDPSLALQARTLQDLVAMQQCMYRSTREATVTVAYLNDSGSPVKDLKFQCTLTAQSGTALTTSTVSNIYEVWQPGEIRKFEIKLPQHEQMHGAICRRV